MFTDSHWRSQRTGHEKCFAVARFNDDADCAVPSGDDRRGEQNGENWCTINVPDFFGSNEKNLPFEGDHLLKVDPNSTSISLLDSARTGQQRAWSEIVRIYGPLVVQWCRRYGIQASDVDDVVQNVFMAVSGHLDKFGQKAGTHSFRGWLWTITRSKIMDHLRKQKALPIAILGSEFWQINTLIAEESHDRSVCDDQQDLQVLVSQVLVLIRQDFSEQTWTAFWRTTALGESPSQVSKDLGMSSAAVCMCRARVLRRVRETLSESD